MERSGCGGAVTRGHRPVPEEGTGTALAAASTARAGPFRSGDAGPEDDRPPPLHRTSDPARSVPVDPSLIYDLTRELRRRALSGTLEALGPGRAAQTTEALARGQRILFAYDDEELYVETPTDRIIRDEGTGRTIGVRRI